VLSLAELQVFRNGRNVALAGTATQSSVAHGGKAERAIDGSCDGVYPNGSVTHTQEEANPWWEVDLGIAQPTDQVTLWNRTDCCAERLQNFSLILLDQDRNPIWSIDRQPQPQERADYSIWGAPLVTPGADLKDRREAQEKINEALDQGAQYLIGRQLRDGSWGSHMPRFGPGQTALSLYALLKSGVSRVHPSVHRALAYLRAHPPVKTYSIGCTLMALQALAQEDLREWMQELVDQLIAGQGDDRPGIWSYPGIEADLSVTQYAILGLQAARKAGLKIPDKVWQKTLEGVFKLQTKQENPRSTAEELGDLAGPGARSAGFSYRPTGQHGNPTGSMTTAGIAVVAICEQALRRKLSESWKIRVSKAQRMGLIWLTDRFTVESNPGKTDRHHYYLYGLERIGSLLGIDAIGTRDWYWEGAAHLLPRQNKGGKWKDETNTCFAMLFLARATAPTTGATPTRLDHLHLSEEPSAAVHWRAVGEGLVSLWITGFGDDVVQSAPLHRGKAVLPTVQEVTYFCNDQEIATLDAAASQAWAGERYAHQHSLGSKGIYQLKVRMRVVDAAAAEDSSPRELWSDPIVIEITDSYERWMDEYAQQGAENLLPKVKVEVKASSQHCDSHKPGHVADGLQSTAWATKEDDPAPSITLELRPPVKANTIVFSGVNLNESGAGEHDRPTQLRVRINRAKDALLVELAATDLEKPLLELPKVMTVRQLDIEIVDRVAGTKHPGAVGFSEIELLRR
jgi:hypothetical protein